jgi:hypothetical protein
MQCQQRGETEKEKPDGTERETLAYGSAVELVRCHRLLGLAAN